MQEEFKKILKSHFSIEAPELEEKQDQELLDYLSSGASVYQNNVFKDVFQRRYSSLVWSILEQIEKRNFEIAYASKLLLDELQAIYFGFKEMDQQIKNHNSNDQENRDIVT